MKIVLLISLFILGCARAKGSADADLSDCRYVTTESREFASIGQASASVYECMRGHQICNVYVAVGGSAVSTDCKDGGI